MLEIRSGFKVMSMYKFQNVIRSVGDRKFQNVGHSYNVSTNLEHEGKTEIRV